MSISYNLIDYQIIDQIAFGITNDTLIGFKYSVDSNQYVKVQNAVLPLTVEPNYQFINTIAIHKWYNPDLQLMQYDILLQTPSRVAFFSTDQVLNTINYISNYAYAYPSNKFVSIDNSIWRVSAENNTNPSLNVNSFTGTIYSSNMCAMYTYAETVQTVSFTDGSTRVDVQNSTGIINFSQVEFFTRNTNIPTNTIINNNPTSYTLSTPRTSVLFQTLDIKNIIPNIRVSTLKCIDMYITIDYNTIFIACSLSSSLNYTKNGTTLPYKIFVIKYIILTHATSFQPIFNTNVSNNIPRFGSNGNLYIFNSILDKFDVFKYDPVSLLFVNNTPLLSSVILKPTGVIDVYTTPYRMSTAGNALYSPGVPSILVKKAVFMDYDTQNIYYTDGTTHKYYSSPKIYYDNWIKNFCSINKISTINMISNFSYPNLYDTELPGCYCDVNDPSLLAPPNGNLFIKSQNNTINYNWPKLKITTTLPNELTNMMHTLKDESINITAVYPVEVSNTPLKSAFSYDGNTLLFSTLKGLKIYVPNTIVNSDSPYISYYLMPTTNSGDNYISKIIYPECADISWDISIIFALIIGGALDNYYITPNYKPTDYHNYQPLDLEHEVIFSASESNPYVLPTIKSRPDFNATKTSTNQFTMNISNNIMLKFRIPGYSSYYGIPYTPVELKARIRDNMLRLVYSDYKKDYINNKDFEFAYTTSSILAFALSGDGKIFITADVHNIYFYNPLTISISTPAPITTIQFIVENYNYVKNGKTLVPFTHMLYMNRLDNNYPLSISYDGNAIAILVTMFGYDPTSNPPDYGSMPRELILYYLTNGEYLPFVINKFTLRQK